MYTRINLSNPVHDSSLLGLCWWFWAWAVMVFCYLDMSISVVIWGFAVGLIKSLVTTTSLPSLRMQRWTIRRTFCNLRSSAKRWGSVRTGCKGSVKRDSLMTSLSLNSDRAKSCSLRRVEYLILKRREELKPVWWSKRSVLSWFKIVEYQDPLHKCPLFRNKLFWILSLKHLVLF